jgi:2-amino-4-hydroxy-6-hydroxymethyldihydropteridine diphosphokinase
MTAAFVSAGSNIDPENNIREALRRLAGMAKVTAISTVYKTQAIAPPVPRCHGPTSAEDRARLRLAKTDTVLQTTQDRGTPPFYNCVVRVETLLPPLELKRRILNQIEEELLRRRGDDKYAPRTIDLDLILYGDLVMETQELRLPDGDILKRPFLVVCLHELAPELVLPGSGASIAQAASAAPREGMEPLERYTDDLRKEIAGMNADKHR